MRSFAIVLADVDVILTEYLSGFLERRGHRVLISAPTHGAVRDAVQSCGADICLLDLALRDSEDITDLRRLVVSCPSTLVVVRTANPSSQLMQSALAAGAAGYVHKSRGAQVLLEALTRVGEGEIVIEGSFVRPATESDPADVAHLRQLVSYLTPRERECLIMLAEGKNTAAIAAGLGVSRTTVRSHVQSVLNKLDVHSRLEAATLAVRCQLTELTTEMTPAGTPARVVRLPAAGERR
jgi:two-component system nitrate/nitrite response regulator NarL